MTQTSTAINGCDASIWLDKSTGVLTDISGSSNTYNMDFDNELGALRNFGSRWPIRLECGKDATFTLAITYTTATDEAVSILKEWYFTNPGRRSVRFYLPDKSIGADLYSGEVRLEKLSVPVEAGKADPILVTATLRPDGEFSWAVNAT